VAEKNYHLHSGKLEFLAMKWAICEQFRDYLYYAPSFVMFTDNPLTYVLSTAKLNATGLRWLGELAEFNFTIFYRPGKANADADTLSRTSNNMNEYMKSCTQKTSQDELRTILSTVQLQEKGQVNWLSALTNYPDVLSADVAIQPDSNRLTFKTNDIQKAQLEDTVIGKVYSLIQADKRPTANQRARESPNTRLLLHKRQKLCIDANGVLRRKSNAYNQIVLPRKYHLLVLKELNDKMGHIGSDECYISRGTVSTGLECKEI
jgi:hypothetical protein